MTVILSRTRGPARPWEENYWCEERNDHIAAIVLKTEAELYGMERA